MEQFIPNITNKYKKYLGKFGDPLNYKDSSKINLYSQKLKTYGTLLQTGAGLSNQLKETVDKVNLSLKGLQKSTDTGKAVEKFRVLKISFDELTSLTNNTKQILDNNTKQVLDNYTDVDTFIQVQMFKNIIKDIGDVTILTKDNIPKLEALTTFPEKDLVKLIKFVQEGDTKLGIDKNEKLAADLPYAVASVNVVNNVIKITDPGTDFFSNLITNPLICVITQIEKHQSYNDYLNNALQNIPQDRAQKWNDLLIKCKSEMQRMKQQQQQIAQ